MYLRLCAEKQAGARFQPRGRELAMQSLRSHRRVDSAPWLLLVALLAVAFASQSAFAAAKVITEADKGGQVHLQTGDTLVVRLKSNPSTGYMWYVHPDSTPLLKLVGQMQIKAVGPSTEQGVVGRPILQVFKFEAIRAGGGVLLLRYVRSWEKSAPDEERFEVHVFIR